MSQKIFKNIAIVLIVIVSVALLMAISVAVISHVLKGTI
jgi:hypothetical protein